MTVVHVLHLCVRTANLSTPIPRHKGHTQSTLLQELKLLRGEAAVVHCTVSKNGHERHAGPSWPRCCWQAFQCRYPWHLSSVKPHTWECLKQGAWRAFLGCTPLTSTLHNPLNLTLRIKKHGCAVSTCWPMAWSMRMAYEAYAAELLLSAVAPSVTVFCTFTSACSNAHTLHYNAIAAEVVLLSVQAHMHAVGPWSTWCLPQLKEGTCAPGNSIYGARNDKFLPGSGCIGGKKHPGEQQVHTAVHAVIGGKRGTAALGLWLTVAVDSSVDFLEPETRNTLSTARPGPEAPLLSASARALKVEMSMELSMPNAACSCALVRPAPPSHTQSASFSQLGKCWLSLFNAMAW